MYALNQNRKVLKETLAGSNTCCDGVKTTLRDLSYLKTTLPLLQGF